MWDKIKNGLKNLIVKKSFWVMIINAITAFIGLVMAYNKTATLEQIAGAWGIFATIITYLVNKFAVDDTVVEMNRQLDPFGVAVVHNRTMGTYRVTREFKDVRNTDDPFPKA